MQTTKKTTNNTGSIPKGRTRGNTSQTAWNQYVNRCARISLRHFARIHNIPFATWQREFRRGAASPIVRRGNRWTYPEYDMDKARASINEGKGYMDAPMKLAVAWRPSSSGTRY